MYSALKKYVKDFPNDFSQASPSSFSHENMSLISLSQSLHKLSLLSKKHQEVEYSKDFVANIDPSSQASILHEVIFLHKALSHFILDNLPED